MGQCLGTLFASPPPNPNPNPSSTSTQNGTAAAEAEAESEAPKLRVFSFSEMKAATKNFRHDTVIGEGGFGQIFKGYVDKKTLAPSDSGAGTMVAIKKHNSDSMQGYKEWQTEVNFLGMLSHPNLVILFGYCWEDKELLLVYEYMQNGSLANHLFRRNPSIEPFPWAKRLQIAIDVAQGLAFLHNPDRNVIHRDIKTSSILLDGNYKAKISNFSLARSGPSGEESHVSTRVMGTYGYAAPEYIATGRLNVKSDVYSFGVVLLEMLTGLKTIDKDRPRKQHNLVDWARPFLGSKSKLSKIMDVKMDGQYLPKAAVQATQIALKCLDQDPKNRPTMKEVAVVLEGIKAMSENPRQSKTGSANTMQ